MARLVAALAVGPVGAATIAVHRAGEAPGREPPALPGGEPVLLPLTGVVERVDLEKMVSRAGRTLENGDRAGIHALYPTGSS